MTLGLGILKHWGCGPYQGCTNDYSGLTLTHLTARSNMIPNAFILEKILKCSFFIFFKPKSYCLREMFNIMIQWFYLSTKCQADM